MTNTRGAWPMYFSSFVRMVLGIWAGVTASVLAWDSTLGAAERAAVVIVVGASGEEEYGGRFREWAARWEKTAVRGGAEVIQIGLDDPGELTDRARLEAYLTATTATGSSSPLWLVLIGHGTFDGKTARFNLRGPDMTPAELAAWLRPVARPLAVINCASCSSPFLTELSGPNRAIVVATRSASEFNFARFGDYLSQAIGDPAADLDKDEQVSLLEAFLRAAAGVREYYSAENRLATEHPLLDDNGDKYGTPADWYRGIHATKAAKNGASLDGPFANQLCLVASPREEQLPTEARLRRDQLEHELAALRTRRNDLPEEEFLKLAEPLLLEIAKLYRDLEKAPAPPAEANPRK